MLRRSRSVIQDVVEDVSSSTVEHGTDAVSSDLAAEGATAATSETQSNAAESGNGALSASSAGQNATGRSGAERPRLGSLLLERGSVNADQLAAALQEQRATATGGGPPRTRIGQLLCERGALEVADLREALAVQFEINLADLRVERPTVEALALLPETAARAHRVVPLRVTGGRVVIATADPADADGLAAVGEVVGQFDLVLASEAEIDHTLSQAYSALAGVDTHIQAFELASTEPSEAEAVNVVVDENQPVVQMVNQIVTQAVRSRASDIHIEPEAHGIRVRFRVDGALTEVLKLPTAMGSPVASRIKVMADLNIVERRRSQDGQFSIEVDGRPIDVRTSIVSTIHGEKTVLRLLDKTRSLISLDKLGMTPAVEMPYLSIVKAPLGMLLCTGPTGAGKTTTLYATLAEINDPRRNVVTLEDPVEYEFAGVNQMQVNEQAGITFAAGLRGILRQDPDVILVGEIRDVDTVRLAVQASLTGHFVLSSIHAVDAASAVHRLTDMGVEPFLVASAVNGVVGQRLVRRICSGCAVAHDPTPAERTVMAQAGYSAPERWSAGTGCNLCNQTGYQGRVGVYELLQVTDQIRELIVAKATHGEIRKAAIEAGMSTMQNEAFRLVAEGKTTVEEVMRSVYSPGADEGSHPVAPQADNIDLASVDGALSDTSGAPHALVRARMAANLDREDRR